MSAGVQVEPFEVSFVDAGLPMHAASWGTGDATHVLVHGLGGSHVDWALVGGALAERGRVFAPDLPGFGRTDPRGRVSLSHMQAALDRFIAATSKGPIVLVGHSMGGALCVLQAAARPETVRALVLVAPALPLERGARLSARAVFLSLLWMTPFLGPWFLRKRAADLGAERSLRETLRAVVKDVESLPPDVMDALVAFERTRPERPWVDAALGQAMRSIVGCMMRPDRLRGAMTRIVAPTLIVQGAEDPALPLSSVQGAIRRCPRFRLEVIDGIGHVPALEAPERFIELVRAFAASAPAG